MRVEIADLGSWGRVVLLAEYDPSDDAIRIDARAAEFVLARYGQAEAERFVACAIAHESFHRACPNGSEAEARRYAAAVSGFDSERLGRSHGRSSVSPKASFQVKRRPRKRS